MKDKKERRILPWWVYVILVIVIIIMLMYELMLSPVAEIDLTFKVIAAIFAIIAIFLTVKRMKQTQEQIEVMSENNRFNNFFKHRDEFVKYLRTKRFIVNLAEYSKLDLDDLLYQYHGIYFTKGYDKFKPEINETLIKRTSDFFGQINNSMELNSGFNETIDSEIPYYLPDRTEDHFIEITRAINHLREIDPLINKKLRGKDMECNCIYELCKLYYTYRIMSNILSFAGGAINIVDHPLAFVWKFTRFLDDSNLSKLRLDQ